MPSDALFSNLSPEEGQATGDEVSVLRVLGYRLAFYLSMTFVDDPAWLAFWFC